MQIPPTRSLPALSCRPRPTRPSWWVEKFQGEVSKQTETAGQSVSCPQSGTWLTLWTLYWKSTSARLTASQAWLCLKLGHFEAEYSQRFAGVELKWKFEDLNRLLFRPHYVLSLSSLRLLCLAPWKISPFDSDTSQGHSFTYNAYHFHAMLKPVFMV